MREPRSTQFENDLRALEPLLLRVAMRSVRERELARDLTQEALLHALANHAQYAGRSTLRTWVLGILAHKVLDALRGRRVALDGDDDSGLLDTASPHELERVVMARQDLRRVEGALTQLPARERLALVLTDIEGLSRDEACHALGVTATHLRVILHRGRNRLRRLCERD